MSHNEWELLQIAEDIEPGDYVLVEEEDGETARAQFVKYERGIVRLKTSNGISRKFRASNLEEIDGEAHISGKADE